MSFLTILVLRLFLVVFTTIGPRDFCIKCSAGDYAKQKLASYAIKISEQSSVVLRGVEGRAPWAL